MNTMTLIGQNSSLGEEVMTITVQKNCPGEGVMAHNLPPLHGSFILYRFYMYLHTILGGTSPYTSIARCGFVSPHVPVFVGSMSSLDSSSSWDSVTTSGDPVTSSSQGEACVGFVCSSEREDKSRQLNLNILPFF